jgi:RNA polymerase sigma factor (sigma-70 family)
MKTGKKTIIEMGGIAREREGTVKSSDWSLLDSRLAEAWDEWEQQGFGHGEGGEEGEEENGGSQGIVRGEGAATSCVKLLSVEEERQLVDRMRIGDISARDRLFDAFRPLAIRLANQCFKSWKSGLERDDLVAWAYIGLMEGLTRFDPKRGARVSSCVTPYVTKAVYRANANYGRLIRIPVNQTEKLTRYYAFVREFEAENGESPSVDAAAQALGIRQSRLENLVAITSSVQSLDAELGDCERGVSLGDRIADTSKGVLEGMMNRERIDEVFIAIDGLDQRESWIVKRRFNLDGEGYCTLDDIANRLDLTKERVRQLEKRALDRLRAAVAA